MRNKRITLVAALLLCAILAGSISVAATSATTGFVDVPSHAWYADAVAFVETHGLMQGMGDNKFQPNTTMSRAMLVTVLWRIEDQPLEGTYYYHDYLDVQDDTWYTRAVAWASNLGIVQGTGPVHFLPDSPVTREQIVTILYRYARDRNLVVDTQGELAEFVDYTKINSWALDAMQWAVGIGLINGIPINDTLTIQPQGNATRAQVATILKRFIEINALPIPYTLDRSYQEILLDRMTRIGYASLGSYEKNDCGGKLVDLDSDGTDELVLRFYHDYRLIFEVWTIRDGVTVCLVSEIFGSYASSGPDSKLSLAEFKGNTYLSHYRSYGESGDKHEIWNLYQISGGIFTIKHQLHIAYNHRDANGNYTPTPIIKYSIDQVEVSAEEFDRVTPATQMTLLLTERDSSGNIIDGCLQFKQLYDTLS